MPHFIFKSSLLGICLIVLAAGMPVQVQESRTAACEALTIANRITPPIIDGHLDDWQQVPAVFTYTMAATAAPGMLDNAGNLQFAETEAVHTDPNDIGVYLAWDERALYAAFDVQDRYLTHLPDERVPEVDILEKENLGIYLYADAEKLLFLNDSIDLHVTSDTSATTQTRPADFQFIVTLLEQATVLRGSTMLQQIVPAWETPKEVDPKVVYEQAVQYKGTLNFNNDADEGYVVELAIPWVAIGVAEPYAGMPLRILAAVNDNEEPLLPIDSGSTPHYFAEDWCGVSDYGLPTTWRMMELAEARTASLPWWPFAAGVAGIIGAGLWLWSRRSPEPVDESASQPIMSAEEQFVQNVQAVVHARLEDDDFSVAALAEAMHMSPRHLHRKISQATGHAPAVFIRTLRLERAALLLVTKHDTIASVAYAVGFSDPSHFSKTFRQQFGLSPSAYRTEKRQKAA